VDHGEFQICGVRTHIHHTPRPPFANDQPMPRVTPGLTSRSCTAVAVAATIRPAELPLVLVDVSRAEPPQVSERFVGDAATA